MPTPRTSPPCGRSPGHTPRRSPPCGRSHGFTLLEVLLATALLALALTLAYGAIRAAVGAVRSGEALIDRTGEIRIIQEFLRRQVSHAMPLAFEELEDNGERKVFEGEAEYLRFVAPMPGYLSRGGPHVQWLSIERGRDGQRLVFDHAQLNGYEPDDPKPDGSRPPVVLLEGIRDAQFEYRTVDPATRELEDWTDLWEDPQQMPVMARLVVEFDRDDQRRWPLLEIPLKLSQGSVAPRRSGRFQPRTGMQQRQDAQRNSGRPPRADNRRIDGRRDGRRDNR